MQSNKIQLTQYCVLVVEDEPDIREMLTACLETENYKVITAENGQAALDIIMKGVRPDMIFSDINMPKMNGITLLDELYQFGLEIPFVFLTGCLGTDPNEAAARAKAFEIMEKPFLIEDLLNMAKKACDHGASIKKLGVKVP